MQRIIPSQYPIGYEDIKSDVESTYLNLMERLRKTEEVNVIEDVLSIEAHDILELAEIGDNEKWKKHAVEYQFQLIRLVCK